MEWKGSKEKMEIRNGDDDTEITNQEDNNNNNNEVEDN